MTNDEIFAKWDARAAASKLSLADVRKRAGVHAANFSNWRNGKGGMTIASMNKIDAAFDELEAAAPAVVTCGTCDRRADQPEVDACTASDCGLRQIGRAHV